MPDADPTGQNLVTPKSEPAKAAATSRPSFAYRAIGWLNAIYVFAFVLAVALLSWWGERDWILSLLLFAPAYVLLAPLALLTPICLFARPRLLLWHLACILFLCFGYMEFSWTSKPAPSSSTLKVVTFNAGEGDRAQFRAFIKAHDPELIVLQDVRSRGASYAGEWPDRFIAGRGEFLVASRYPVREAEFGEQPNWGGRPIAARFEVSRSEGALIVYDVHLPTPRGELRRFLSRRVISNIFGDEEHGKAFASYREWVDARIQMARQFAAVLAAEKAPFIVCGDFNTPDHGYIHRILAGDMIDAHASAGRGWGLSFPGGTGGRAARLGPWLRIDYAYAGRGWRPVYCETDLGRRSQHRAVAAYFAPLH